MPERHQNVSGNSIGLPLISKTISHNVPQNLHSTDLLSLNHAGPTAHLETTETSPDGDLLRRPLLPFISTSFNGETIPSQEEDSFLAPHLINLETTGLRRSSRLAALNGITQDDPAIVAHTSSTKPLKS
jgi:hypothetical protein